jgi:ubiquinone/menaquinone biosynthesis C-methylase UbiE
MKKEWTGERLETFVFSETTIEHLHRYAIACEVAKNKAVLDIACGEGYGSNLLAQKATHVTGVDIDNATIQKAKQKYTHSNLSFITGDVRKTPCPNHSFDIVVSFETIEHIEEQAQMIQEIKRVLKPGGLLIISTPDKKYYADKRQHNNPFHKKELYEAEFIDILKGQFTNVSLLYQQMINGSIITTFENHSFLNYGGNFEKLEKNKVNEPMYIIALASDNLLPVINSSLFSGQSIMEQALLEKEKMITSTITYRLGHILLYPFKVIRNLFKRH